MSNSTCLSPFTYITSPDFLIFSLHLIFVISTPTYILGVYCILFKTPKEMISVKWYLLTLHIWVIVLDYAVCLLVVPYVLLDVYGWVSFGWLDYIGVPVLVQGLLPMIAFSYLITSIISIFENRFYILCVTGQSFWAIGRRIWLIGHHVYFILVLIPLIYLVPDQTEARKSLHVDACILNFFDKDKIFILTTNMTYHFLATVFSVLLITAELFIFALFLYLSVSDQQAISRISAKTLQMRKQFLIALLIQTSIPVVMFTAPIGIAGCLLLMEKITQGFMNGCMVFAMTHGFVSTLVMIVVHKPYRLAVIGMIRRTETRRRLTVVTVKVSRS